MSIQITHKGANQTVGFCWAVATDFVYYHPEWEKKSWKLTQSKLWLHGMSLMWSMRWEWILSKMIFFLLWFQTRNEFDHFNSKNIPQNILKTIWETSNDGIDILYIKKNRRIGGLDGAFCLFLPQGSKSLFAISNLAHFFSSYLELSHHALHFNSHGIKSTITSESINTRASCPEWCIWLIKFHMNKSKGICWLPSLLYVWRVWKLQHVHRLSGRCYQ